jgi:hypothetical protein
MLCQIGRDESSWAQCIAQQSDLLVEPVSAKG